MSLYELVKPKCKLDELELPTEVVEQIRDILDDHIYQDALLENGLSLRKKILLHGPSGCGKTSIAHALAVNLSMPLYISNSSQIVGSHLGDSAKNIDSVIKFAHSNRVVMLMDEFDSIGSVRADSDSGSGKQHNQMVNTILTGLEDHPPLGLIVACTNLFGQIDGAILRRFDLVAEIPTASKEALKKIAENIVAGRFGISTGEILQEATNPSSVVRVATNKLRRAVIDEEKRSLASKLAKIKSPKSHRPEQISFQGVQA